MTKFEKVKEALQEATRDSGNFLSLVEGPRDARDSNGGYHTVNVITNNCHCYYKTLDSIIEEFELKI